LASAYQPIFGANHGNDQSPCVENRPEYTEVLTFILEAAGCKVVPATRRGQALDRLAIKPVDAVLLEAEIKRIKPEIPVLLFCPGRKSDPSLIRYFNTYVRNLEQPENTFEELANDCRFGHLW
jgi:hypothetical protein